jgi:MoaA/NifB/PqqE/SkfB family radical SAM enzyme
MKIKDENIPASVVLHFDACNQRCLFCMKSDDLERKKKLLDYKQAQKIILQAKKDGHSKIDLFGGEPTIFPFFKKVVIFAQKNGMVVTLATNGTVFSSNKYAEDFFSSVDINKITFRISLHGDDPKVHDKITQVRGSHSKTVDGIRNILKHTNRVTVNIVITALNYSDLARITLFARELGLRGIKYAGLTLDGRILKHKDLLIDYDKYRKHLLKALFLAKKVGFKSIAIERVPELLSARAKSKELGFIISF